MDSLVPVEIINAHYHLRKKQLLVPYMAQGKENLFFPPFCYICLQSRLPFSKGFLLHSADRMDSACLMSSHVFFIINACSSVQE